MAFWPMLGGITAYLGKVLIDKVFVPNDTGSTNSDVVTQQLTKTNWNDILHVCEGVLNRNVEPVSAIGNMRTSLQEQDPKVIKMALKVLESVLEERGIPARTDEEASQFLRDMRQLLRDSRDRDVRDGVFELNDAWSRACRNSQQFRGVGDLVELLNAEGYRVLVTRDSSRAITNENTNGAYCDKCDSQLPFDQLKHFCQYCRRIFCSSCCSYQRGMPPFQGNTSVCMCHECKMKNNTNFSPQATADYRQTSPKVYNNVWDASFEPSPQQRGRTSGDKNDDEDVHVNLVVPHHIAENPEGWKISVQCTKTDNATSGDSAQKEKKENNDLKWTLEHSDDKLFEKDVWQANSDSGKIITKSVMENNKYAPSERNRCENTEKETCVEGQQNSRLEEQREEEHLQIALEHSKQTAIEDMELQRALEMSRRESEEMERKFAKYEVSDEEEDMQLQDTRRGALRKKTNKARRNSARRDYRDDNDDDGDDEMHLDITDRQRLKNNTRSGKGPTTFEVRSSRYPDGKNRHRSKEHSEKSKQQNRKCKDEYDRELQIALRCSLEENPSARRNELSTSGSEDSDRVSEEESTSSSKPKCCYKHAENKKWEEDEALERAIQISLKEFKQPQESSTSASENNDEDSEEESASTSKPGPSYRSNKCREDKKDNLIHDTEQHEKCCYEYAKCKQWEEQEALDRAIKLSLKEVKQVCKDCDKYECVCDDTLLQRAIELSRQESVNRQVASCDSGVSNLVLEQDSGVKSNGKQSTEEELRQKRLRYFSREKTKEEAESLGHSSKQDAEITEENDQCEEELHISSSSREKIAMIEEAEIKLAMQLSLQEMLEKEQDTSKESEDEDENQLLVEQEIQDASCRTLKES